MRMTKIVFLIEQLIDLKLQDALASSYDEESTGNFLQIAQVKKELVEELNFQLGIDE